jgi:RNA 2',3'-cyclic 3'-phosphodiesterase
LSAVARLFVAADPPASVREQLAAWARGVRASLGSGGAGRGREALRLVDVDSLHLTLCFLGDRPVGEIDALADALRSCPERSCELSVGAPLWLPPRRPRALAVEIDDPDGELAQIQAQVCGALCEASGWEPQRRRFRAHVTVARMREGALGASYARPLEPTPQLRFAPESIVLYRSWLAPAGATYEALETRELAPAD